LFTGLVADVGEVLAVERDQQGALLQISSPLARELCRGGSIAVAGACLTAVEVPASDRFAAQAMHETLARTTIGALAPGSRVNLELPLRPSDRLGGHIVQGHVDGTATVTDVRSDGFARVLTFAVEPSLMRYLVEKGSVAVDGVSLTVASLAADSFCASLIPETLARTTLGTLVPGGEVNLEVDILAKHVQRLLAPLP
jgi:riboflavin synthase